MANDQWKMLKANDWYEIHVPEAATWKYNQESETLMIQLPQEGDELFVARWAFNDTDNTDREVAIDQSLRAFMTQVGGEGKDWQYTSQSRDGRKINQGLMPIDLSPEGLDSTQWWIARFEIARDGEHYYFMHWNGPFRVLTEVVMEVMENFEPIEG